jgi:RNA polymerase primary sigma factor
MEVLEAQVMDEQEKEVEIRGSPLWMYRRFPQIEKERLIRMIRILRKEAVKVRRLINEVEGVREALTELIIDENPRCVDVLTDAYGFGGTKLGNVVLKYGSRVLKSINPDSGLLTLVLERMKEEGKQDDVKFRRLLSGHRRCVNLKRRIVEGNIRLVFHVAKKYTGYGVPLEDLVQEGIIGLMRGVDRYDPDRGTEFSTLVVEWIEQSIQKVVLSYRHIVSFPARLLERTWKILRAEAQLRQELEREPGFGEIAERAGLSEEEVKEISALQPPLSLDEPVGDDEDFTLMDVLGYEDDPSRYMSIVPEVIKDFPEKERMVLQLRYGLHDGIERTLEEVGQKLGVTKERVRQIELKGFERLKKRLRR